MKKICHKDIVIISALRNNARESLKVIGAKFSIPTSTVYDKIRSYEKDVIKKHVTLIDFSKMGFLCQVTIAIKLAEYQIKELYDFAKNRKEVNNAYEINHGYDILMECIFPSRTEMKLFLEELENNFKIQEKHIFETISQIKQEAFMAEMPDLLN